MTEDDRLPDGPELLALDAEAREDSERARRGHGPVPLDPWDPTPALAPPGACCQSGAVAAPCPCPTHDRPEENR